MPIFVREFLFWLHMTLMVAGLLLGFFFPFTVVFLLVILHKIHVRIFDGCALSRLQERLGALPRGVTFIQAAAKRFFRANLSTKQVQIVDNSLATIALGIALLRQFVHS